MFIWKFLSMLQLICFVQSLLVFSAADLLFITMLVWNKALHSEDFFANFLLTWLQKLAIITKQLVAIVIDIFIIVIVDQSLKCWL